MWQEIKKTVRGIKEGKKDFRKNEGKVKTKEGRWNKVFLSKGRKSGAVGREEG